MHSGCFKEEFRLQFRSAAMLGLAVFVLVLFVLGYYESFTVIDNCVAEGMYSYANYRNATFPPVLLVFLMEMMGLLPTAFAVYSYVSAHRDQSSHTLQQRLLRYSYAELSAARVAVMLVIGVFLLLLFTLVGTGLQLYWNSRHGEFAYVFGTADIISFLAKAGVILLTILCSLLIGLIAGGWIHRPVLGVLVSGVAAFLFQYGVLWICELLARAFQDTGTFESVTITFEGEFAFSVPGALALTVLTAAALGALAVLTYRVNNEK